MVDNYEEEGLESGGDRDRRGGRKGVWRGITSKLGVAGEDGKEGSENKNMKKIEGK